MKGIRIYENMLAKFLDNCMGIPFSVMSVKDISKKLGKTKSRVRPIIMNSILHIRMYI